MAGAALYALVLGGIGLVVAAMTPRRGVGVAAVVGVLLISSGLQAAVMAILGERDSGYSGLISPFTLVDGVVAGVFGADSSIGLEPPGLVGALVFAAVALAVIVACYAILVARYRKALS
jgi:ABC-2 type transport system permease protein